MQSISVEKTHSEVIFSFYTRLPVSDVQTFSENYAVPASYPLAVPPNNRKRCNKPLSESKGVAL
ncbi:MAG: hypothetical protein O4804_17710 [Trichodesmium sp. St11_bin5]|nr:hypothetical protein [Trichodesmium sp. St11_bin5]MDT9337931.1 hypothetical protein [Trichodesmium erythraeum 21-75]